MYIYCIPLKIRASLSIWLSVVALPPEGESPISHMQSAICRQSFSFSTQIASLMSKEARAMISYQNPHQYQYQVSQSQSQPQSPSPHTHIDGCRIRIEMDGLGSGRCNCRRDTTCRSIADMLEALE